jgi:hypothetical protein
MRLEHHEGASSQEESSQHTFWRLEANSSSGGERTHEHGDWEANVGGQEKVLRPLK